MSIFFELLGIKFSAIVITAYGSVLSHIIYDHFNIRSNKLTQKAVDIAAQHGHLMVAYC